MTTTIRPIKITDEDKVSMKAFSRLTFAGIVEKDQEFKLGGDPYKAELIPHIYDVVTLDHNQKPVDFAIQAVIVRRQIDNMRFAIIACNLANPMYIIERGRKGFGVLDNIHFPKYDHAIVTSQQVIHLDDADQAIKGTLDALKTVIEGLLLGISGRKQEVSIPE